ncbi:MoaD/ThiS family protein [Nanoarchaeota archaeon]
MKIEIINLENKKKKNITIKKNETVESLLEKLKINPVTVIVAVNNNATIKSTLLKNNDKVKIIPVVSGG